MGISQAGKLILQALKASWDHFTTLIVLNLAWFFLWLLPMFINSITSDNLVWFLICVAASLFLLGPVTAAIQHLINQIIRHDELSVSEFIQAFKKYFWRSQGLVLIGIVTILLIVVNFTITSGSASFIMRVITGMWLYLALFWLLVAQFVFPFLVQYDLGVWTIIKRSAMLVVDNLLVSLILLLVCGLLTFISLFLVIPFVILWFTVISLMQNLIMVELLEKYSNGHSKEVE
ncbi:MAG: DUF624 domain-containing protein [Candidatus Wallacebacter cryptica]|jgi:uncharacterized membrane protein YesL|nr:DUF624 domain-containing protein [Bacillota bacterium]